MISTDSCIIVYYIEEKKAFYRCCLQAFITEELLKRQINNCFKTNGKQTIETHKKGGYVKLKIVERKRKLPFTIYVDL